MTFEMTNHYNDDSSKSDLARTTNPPKKKNPSQSPGDEKFVDLFFLPKRLEVTEKTTSQKGHIFLAPGDV